MAFQRIVQTLWVLLVVLAVSTHAQLEINGQDLQGLPKLFEVNPDNFQVNQHQLDQAPEQLVQQVLSKITLQELTPNQLLQNQFPQTPLTPGSLTQGPSSQDLMSQNKIVITNNVDKESPENKNATKPGQPGSSGLVEIASGQLDLGKQKLGQEVIDREFLLQQVLGSLEMGQQKLIKQKFVQQQPLDQPQLDEQELAKKVKRKPTIKPNGGQKPQKLTGQKPQRIEGQRPQKLTGQKPKKKPGKKPQQLTGQKPQKKPGKKPQQLTGQKPQKKPGKKPQQLTGQKPQRIKGQRPQKLTGQKPQKKPGKKPQQLTGQKPQKKPGKKPQQLTGQKPQNVTGQKPQKGGNKKRPQNNKEKPEINTTPDNKDHQKVITNSIPELGRVLGRLGVSQWTGKQIMQFFDIPYGQAPVGELRFKPSLPVEPWTGVMKTNIPHPGCPSMKNMEAFNGNNLNMENCLRLSVNTKQLNGSAPVMVYLHGDFLNDGSSLEAAPGYMLEEDVVLVSVRYRLGPLGFLSTMSDEIPGNAAVHDVILALQWIQKNIAHFGGDPSRVTLFGQVGGAALVNILTISPAVPENLFHRVILQSGSALSPAFVTQDPMPAVRDIAKYAGCTNLDSAVDLNKCLLQLNTMQLLKAFKEHADSKASQDIVSNGGAQFVIGGPSGVLPVHPGKLMAAENLKAYPTMGGSVKNAGSFMLKHIFIDNFNESVADDLYDGNGYIEYIIKQTNGEDPTSQWKKYATEEIFSADDIKNGSFHRMLPGLMDMCSTIAFKNPVLLALKANAKKLPKATYLYSFDYTGERNRYEPLEDDDLNMPFDLGVSITDDNLYLFPWPKINMITSNRDLKIAKRMVALWTSFATTGVPHAPGLPEWPAMSGDTGPYMKLDTTVSIADNYLNEYSVAVKEAKMGFSLVNEDYFESLEDVSGVVDVQPVKDDDDTVVVVEELRANSN